MMLTMVPSKKTRRAIQQVHCLLTRATLEVDVVDMWGSKEGQGRLDMFGRRKPEGIYFAAWTQID